MLYVVCCLSLNVASAIPGGVITVMNLFTICFAIVCNCCEFLPYDIKALHLRH